MKKGKLFSHIGFSAIAALVYCICLLFFIKSDQFKSIYLLYIGNVLFGIAISLFMLFHTKSANEGATTTLITAGIKVAITAIILSAITALILLLIFKPDLFLSGVPTNDPSRNLVQNLNNNTESLVIAVYFNLVVGNIAAGSFASLIFAYSPTFNQADDKTG